LGLFEKRWCTGGDRGCRARDMVPGC
jgi:hypothetical protein